MKNLRSKILNLKLLLCKLLSAYCLLLTAFCLLITVNSFATVKNQRVSAIYPTIQAAVDAAINGDKLLVSTGLYLESVFITNKFIEMEGGYISPMFSSRITDNSSTIIGTNIVGAVVNISLSGGASLDTFTITGGSLQLWPPINGSGVLIDYDCICTMKNCQVYGNSAYYGGGISAWSNSTLFVDNCIISHNESLFGGGGIAGYIDSKITLTNKTGCIGNFSFVGGGIAVNSKNLTINGGASVVENIAISKGGGIYLDNCGLCNIFGENTSIGETTVENQVTNGCGGGIYAVNSSIIISGKNCRVNGGAASDSGGGIYLTNSSLQLLDEAELGRAVPFSVNSAETNGGCLWMGRSTFIASGGAKVLMGHAGMSGGGIYADSSYLSFSNTVLGCEDKKFGNYASLGGGIYIVNSTAAFVNSYIEGNFALSYGGGAFCSPGSTIYGCSISENNSTVYGGGIYCVNGSVISDCTFYKNSSEIGGGIYCSKGGMISGCTFYKNNASYGGGAFGSQGGTISGCSISENNSTIYGGGICLVDSGTVSYCNISGNNSSSNGGGAYLRNGGAVFNCIFSNNTASINGGGAYFYLGGALTNCLISVKNSAASGGGVYCDSGGALYNCTIAGNNADQIGGGIVCSNGGTVVNTIIYNNKAFSGGNNWKTYAANIVFNYCCTTPTTNLPSSNQCITNNPMFVVPGSDYTLQEGSPCIDAGFNMAWMTPPATDLAGNPRLHDGTVDIGCYEFVPEPGAFGAVISYLLLVLSIYRKFDFIKNQI